MNLEEIIKDVYPRLTRRANALPDRMRDDAVQEACISIWHEEAKILAARDPIAYAVAVGLVSIRRFASERAATGAPPRSEGTGRVFQRTTPTISADALRELGIELAATPDIADEAVRNVEPERNPDVAFDAILAGLGARDAKIVDLRFRGGMLWEDIADELGLPRTTITSRWRRTLKPALASQLAV